MSIDHDDDDGDVGVYLTFAAEEGTREINLNSYERNIDTIAIASSWYLEQFLLVFSNILNNYIFKRSCQEASSYKELWK